VIEKAEEVDDNIEEIAEKIYTLESSNGKNNYSKCEAIHKFNGSGFGINGKGKYLCFDSREDEKKAVYGWFEEKLKSHSLSEAICGYNLGFQSLHLQDCINKSVNFPYYYNYLTL